MIRVYNTEITKATIEAAKAANKAIKEERNAISKETPDMTACTSAEIQHARALGWPEWLISIDDDGHVFIDGAKITRIFRDVYTVEVEELTAEEGAILKNEARERNERFHISGEMDPDTPAWFVFTWNKNGTSNGRQDGCMTVKFSESEFYASRARHILKERIDRGELPKPFKEFDVEILL